jgi:hypothetical protein
MKTFALVFCLIFLGVAVATAEDLGALAKKEKERREALAKEGKKSKTFTNADIQDLKATLAIESNKPDQTSGTGRSDATRSDSAETRTRQGDQAKRPSDEGQAGDGQNVSPEQAAAERDAQIQDLKQQKEDLENQAAESRGNVDKGGTYFTPELGTQYQKARQAEEEAAKVDDQIKKLEEEKKKESEE